ncbi:MAG: type II toxin-antitoxin system VapC family toxin [Spirochaetaceae bacterium]|nr:MAG: type II toxin-antitoxin system VapC family toxin [Spirochaetaceae bacterium]
MYVLDTNTLIYFFKDQGSVAKMLLSTPPAEVAVPAVVVYELETGIKKSQQPERRMQQLGALLDATRVLQFDRACAAESARARAELERLGTPIGPIDVLIAGTVLAHDGILVTHNVQEFRRVSGLRLSDWYDPR